MLTRLTILAALLLGAHAAARAQTPATAFVDVNVLPMDGDRLLRHHTVVVRDGRIAVLGPTADVRVPAGATRIDGNGKFLLSGLSDMHAHLGGTDSAEVWRNLMLYAANGVTTIRAVDYLKARDFVEIVMSSPGDSYDAADDPARWWLTPDDTGYVEYLKCGGCNMPPADLFRWRARAAAGDIWSPRIATSGPWRIDADATIEQNLAAYQAAGYDFVKVHDESAATIDSVVRAARRLGLPVAGHATAVGAAAAAALGYASVEHLTGYPGGHDAVAVAEPLADTMLLPELARAAARAGMWNVPTLAHILGRPRAPAPLERRYADAEMRFIIFRRTGVPLPNDASGLPPDGAGVGTNVAAQDPLTPADRLRQRTVEMPQDAGAGLLIGTDAFAGPRGCSVHHELQALVDAGLTPYQALVAATRNAAAYFGALDSSGTVAVGKRADLLLLSADPLEEIRNTGEIAGVMVGGRWMSRVEMERMLDAVYADAYREPVSQ